MTRRIRTWVLVADGANAKIFEAQEKGRDLEEVYSRAQDAKTTHEIVSDRQGRSDQPGAAHHAVEPRTDPQRHAEHEFARDLCRHLDASAAAEAFDRLVVTAAPRTLGDIREMMTKQVRDRVHAEIDKDLVHLSAHDLARRLADAIER